MFAIVAAGVWVSRGEPLVVELVWSETPPNYDGQTYIFGTGITVGAIVGVAVA